MGKNVVRKLVERGADVFIADIDRYDLRLLHESWAAGVDKFVALGTICCYPKFTPVPFGQPRRKLDTRRAKERFEFEASVKFEEGLKKTIE